MTGFLNFTVDGEENERQHVKYIPCSTIIDHIYAQSRIQCLEDELIYVEKQVLIAGILSTEDSATLCDDSLTSGICTQTMPDQSQVGGGSFSVGRTCNLQVDCVLDKDLIEKSVDAIHNTSCKFVSTGLTYSCIQSK